MRHIDTLLTVCEELPSVSGCVAEIKEGLCTPVSGHNVCVRRKKIGIEGQNKKYPCSTYILLPLLKTRVQEQS